MTSQRLQIALGAAGVFLVASTIAVPLYAIRGLLFDPAIPITSRDYFMILYPHLTGPILALMVGSVVLALSINDKRIYRWLILVATIGLAHAVNQSRLQSHEFSHAVLDQCTGYSDLIFTLSCAGAVALALVFVVDERRALRIDQKRLRTASLDSCA